MDGTPQEFGITGITLRGGGVPPSDFSEAAAPPFVDPLGLNHCVDAASCGGGGGDCANDPNCDGELPGEPGFGGYEGSDGSGL